MVWGYSKYFNISTTSFTSKRNKTGLVPNYCISKCDLTYYSYLKLFYSYCEIRNLSQVQQSSFTATLPHSHSRLQFPAPATLIAWYRHSWHVWTYLTPCYLCLPAFTISSLQVIVYPQHQEL